MSEYVDHGEIKLGQILTIILAMVALLQQQIMPLLLLVIVFLLSGTIRSVSPFSLLYNRVVQPLGLMRSDYRLDNIEPHKFGQLIGALTVTIALSLIYLNYPLVGWSVITVLILLTAISYSGWCIGCFIYYQLHRMGVGGFFRHKAKDPTLFPGMRPRRDEDRDAEQ